MSYEDLLPPDAYVPKCAMLSIKLKQAYDLLKAKFPGIYVNIRNGRRVHDWAGLRHAECPVGAKYSAHKQGIAMDIHADNLAEVRAWILNGNPLGITRMENSEATPTWCHVDFAPLNDAQKKRLGDGLVYIFNP